MFIKKNIVPTTKLINVATNAVVFFPSSPFINASSAVDTPAKVAKYYRKYIFHIIPPNLLINKFYDTGYLLIPKFEVYKNLIVFLYNIKLP